MKDIWIDLIIHIFSYLGSLLILTLDLHKSGLIICIGAFFDIWNIL